MTYPNQFAVNAPWVTSLGTDISINPQANQTFAIGITQAYEVDPNGLFTTVPLGQSGPFVLKVGSEQILCTSFSEGVVEVYQFEGTNGRAYDSTTAAHHNPGTEKVTIISTSTQSLPGGTVTSIVAGQGMAVSGSGAVTVSQSGQTIAAVLTKTGAYAMTGAESVVLATGACTLPSPVTFAGILFTVKDSGSGTASILPNASETIDGASSISLGTAYKAATVVSNGTNWFVVNDVSTTIL